MSRFLLKSERPFSEPSRFFPNDPLSNEKRRTFFQLPFHNLSFPGFSFLFFFQPILHPTLPFNSNAFLVVENVTIVSKPFFPLRLGSVAQLLQRFFQRARVLEVCELTVR